MNLHILPDSKFTEAFYVNMKEAGLLENNFFVIRSNHNELKAVKQNIPFASLYSRKFSQYVGDLSRYQKIFIHQLSPLMYRWIARNSVREIHWMSWGTDLYNLPFVKANFYESETLKFVKRSKFDVSNFLYVTKVYLTNMLFKNKAYSKVRSLLTWMHSEVEFARAHIPALKVTHEYFFYENQMPYERIDEVIASTKKKDLNAKLKLIIGNSGTPTNNHIDAIRLFNAMDIEADLYIPVSYGDPEYIAWLMHNTGFYNKGKIIYMEEFMDFEAYVRFLYSADGIVMNHIRPQGYGNIFMMMYMDKPVLLNPANNSLRDLDSAGLRWVPIDKLATLRTSGAVLENQSQIKKMLSHDRLINLYRGLFS